MLAGNYLLYSWFCYGLKSVFQVQYYTPPMSMQQLKNTLVAQMRSYETNLTAANMNIFDFSFCRKLKKSAKFTANLAVK